jgi:hypothetical protein
MKKFTQILFLMILAAGTFITCDLNKEEPEKYKTIRIINFSDFNPNYNEWELELWRTGVNNVNAYGDGIIKQTENTLEFPLRSDFLPRNAKNWNGTGWYDVRLRINTRWSYAIEVWWPLQNITEGTTVLDYNAAQQWRGND